MLSDPTVSDNCGSFSLGNDAPTTFPIGMTTVTWMAQDMSGNMATCQQIITVADTIAPVIMCPGTVSVAAGPTCTAIGVALGSVVVDDNCGIMSTTNDAPTSYPLGETTVTWTVTDIYGNTSTCETIVEVTDNDPPMITCGADITVSADPSCQATSVTLSDPMSTDNCEMTTLANDAPSVYPIGTTTITWTITDEAGLTATCQQDVTVIDDQDPIITCPDSVIVNSDVGLCLAAAVSLGSPTTSDNCGIASVTNDAPATFAIGATDVTWTITDNSGNMATCIQVIVVEDNEAPTITCPANISESADTCLLYTSPSPRDRTRSRMPSSA